MKSVLEVVSILFTGIDCDKVVEAMALTGIEPLADRLIDTLSASFTPQRVLRTFHDLLNMERRSPWKSLKPTGSS